MILWKTAIAQGVSLSVRATFWRMLSTSHFSVCREEGETKGEAKQEKIEEERRGGGESEEGRARKRVERVLLVLFFFFFLL